MRAVLLLLFSSVLCVSSFTLPTARPSVRRAACEMADKPEDTGYKVRVRQHNFKHTVLRGTSRPNGDRTVVTVGRCREAL